MKMPLFYLVSTNDEWAFTWKGKTAWTLMQVWCDWRDRHSAIAWAAMRWFFVTYGFSYTNANLANYMTLDVIPLHNPGKMFRAIRDFIRKHNRKK